MLEDSQGRRSSNSCKSDVFIIDNTQMKLFSNETWQSHSKWKENSEPTVFL